MSVWRREIYDLGAAAGGCCAGVQRGDAGVLWFFVRTALAGPLGGEYFRGGAGR